MRKQMRAATIGCFVELLGALTNVRAVAVAATVAAALAALAATPAGAVAPKPTPGTYEFTYKGATSQGSAIRIVARAAFFKDGRVVIQGSGARAKVTVKVKVQCPAYADKPAGPRSYAMTNTAMPYTGSPTGFDIQGDLIGPILPDFEREFGTLTGRARLVNYLPTSSSTIKGGIQVTAVAPVPFDGGGPTCLSGKVTYRAKYASKRRVRS